ncbi:phage tail protein [Clostridium algidicarnis]|uniref:phage tail protein n=1 Tax=Clostridium algidicarnis TaxID=37659 RepID=UPI001C0C923C|nr:hypothetical protein [Clostridium algidicarnis]MBU3226809.1 hypothetical protein [Clostridium algidicarnis]MBU3250280.1 hypothetical protein [Clostridium algidicarnis]
MSDSVGKISLDLEIKSDVEKQIGAISNMIGKNMKAAIEGSTGNMFSGMKKQMDKTLGSMGSTLKKSLDGMKDTAKNALSGAFATAKDIKLPRIEFPKSNVSMPKQAEPFQTAQPRAPPIPKINTGVNLEVVRTQIDNLTRGLDITNSKIEQQREKLTGLKESYANAFNQDRKNKLQEEILKTETSINKLIGTSDKAGFKLGDLDRQFEVLSNTAKNATAGVSSATNNIGKINGSASKVSSSLKRASSASQETNKHTGILGRTADSTGSKFSNMGSVISRSFSRVLRQVFVIGIMYKAMRGLIDYTSSALMTNAQFVNSLRQVQSNLMVAFMPIYTAILPALNALMQGVATVTAYIASAISALFGKTYKQSFNAAKGLNATKAAMAGVGKATKGAGGAAKKAGEEAKGALAGFDEINQLDIDKNKDTETPDGGSGGGGGLDVPEMIMPLQIDMSGIDKFKEIMAGIFEPFKIAWENEGQNTINAMKYALEEVKELIKAIGRSWFEVWTNGTGQLIVESLLRILQLIFNIIGDIAKATRLAWEENNLGTLLMQTIANTLLYILNLVEQIGASWRSVWNNGSGQQIMSTILMILQNIFQLIGGIASAFTNAWVNAGTGTAIIQAIHNIIQSVLDIVKRVGESLNNVWGEVGNVVAQTFLDILKSTLEVLANLGEKLVWVWDNGGQHLFEGFLKLGAKIFEIAGNIYTELVVPFTNGFVDNMAPAVATVLDKVGELCDYLAGDGSGITKAFIELFIGFKAVSFVVEMGIATAAIISNTVASISNTVAKGKDIIETGILIALYTKDAMVKGASTIAQWAHNAAVGAWNIICGVATIATAAFGAAVAFLTSPIGVAIIAITALIAIGVLLYKNWDEVKVFLLNIWETIKQKAIDIWSSIEKFFEDTWNSIKQYAIDIWNGLKAFFDELWKDISNLIHDTWNSIKKFFGDTWDGIKQYAIDVWSALKDFFSELWKEIGSLISDTWNNIKQFLEDTWSSIEQIAINIWNAIRDFFSDTWNSINSVASIAWNGLKDMCQDVFNGLYTIISDIWNSIKGVFNGILDFIVGVFTGNWRQAWEGVKEIFRGVFNGLEAIAKAPLNGIITLVNSVISGLNSISLPDWVPGIGGKGINIPKIPFLARGGIINQPTLSMVGESGKEAVVPLENNTEWMDKVSASVANAIMAIMQLSNNSDNSNDSKGDMVMQLDGVTFARLIKNYTDGEKQRQGNNLIIQTT